MRRVFWAATAVLALAVAGTAVAWGAGAFKTDPVAASFTTDDSVNRTRSCTGSDGHTYRRSTVVLEGSITGDLSGDVVFRLHIREDVTTGYGTIQGRMRVDNEAGGRVLAVLSPTGVVNGLIDGRVFGKGWLLANFSATWSNGQLVGQLGGGSAANTAVVQTRWGVRCDGNAKPEKQPKPEESAKTGELEVRKVVVASGSDDGRFDLRIDGKTEASGVGNGGSTGEETVSAGSHEVSEKASGGTDLDDYTTAIQCVEDGNVVASGGADGDLDVNVGQGDDVVCTITNTRKS